MPTMEMERRQVGVAIREKRVARGMTLRELAKAVQITPGYLSMIERGLTYSLPSEERRRKIAQVLNLAGRELLIGRSNGRAIAKRGRSKERPDA